MDSKEFGKYFTQLRKDSGFSSQRQLAELRKEHGLVGIHHDGGLHLDPSELVGLPNLELSPRDCEYLPYEVSTEINGLSVFTVFNESKKHLFPELFKEEEAHAN